MNILMESIFPSIRHTLTTPIIFIKSNQFTIASINQRAIARILPRDEVPMRIDLSGSNVLFSLNFNFLKYIFNRQLRCRHNIKIK